MKMGEIRGSAVCNYLDFRRRATLLDHDSNHLHDDHRQKNRSIFGPTLTTDRHSDDAPLPQKKLRAAEDGCEKDGLQRTDTYGGEKDGGEKGGSEICVHIRIRTHASAQICI